MDSANRSLTENETYGAKIHAPAKIYEERSIIISSHEVEK